jgi:glutathione S-transferase
MLKLWGRNNSVNVQKAIWCLEELKVPYERIDAGMQYGVVDEPQFRSMNPNGLVPVIEDGGAVLWESNAIVRYLGAKYGKGSLWAQDAAVRAQSDKWMDWCATVYWPAMRTVFWGLVRTPPEKRDMKEIDAARKRVRRNLKILDAALADRLHRRQSAHHRRYSAWRHQLALVHQHGAAVATECGSLVQASPSARHSRKACCCRRQTHDSSKIQRARSPCYARSAQGL